MPIRPVLIDVKGENLVGVWQFPAGEAASPAALLCHGFTGTSCDDHRIMVLLARRLEAVGIASLRFDFRGSGHSEGDFCDMTVAREVEDAQRALDWIARQKESDEGGLGAVGHSLGGVITSLLAGKDKRVKAAVLWAAPSSVVGLGQGARTGYKKTFYKSREVYDLNGDPLSVDFPDSCQGIDPVRAACSSGARFLVCHGTKDAAVPVSCADDYVNALRRAGRPVDKFIIDGADHCFCTIERQEQIHDRTTEWLKAWARLKG